eukprot:3121705-Rhodomonas_salina.1
MLDAHNCTTQCAAGQYIAAECTAVQNTVCAECPDANWCDMLDAHNCTAQCAAGQYIAAECTSVQNT